MVLIGGTSHTGKSTVARAVADRLGFGCLSTDGLARHPGRPWPTPDWQVPPHVDEHYRSLTVDELTTHARAEPDTAGLVLEGSALWPASGVRLAVPHTAAVWLTADEGVLTARMHASCHYDRLPARDRLPVDRFLARTLRYRTMLLDSVARLRPDHIDTSTDRSPEDLVEAVPAAAEAQVGVGRTATRSS
ncbi:hypothetical protein ACFZDK_29490 [Streptomyces sp. NPDC007901]|uniref:hypothetical protein n=1 Tax=Streptomyces sp. NPDC007901 TaxID=3364785 RepID=UPI0036F0B040